MAKGPIASTFAHLAGLGGRPAAARAENTDDKNPPTSAAEDDKKPTDDAQAASADDQTPADDKDKTGASADGEGDCPECDGTGKDEDGADCPACDGSGKTAKKATKAKASDDDDDDQSEMNGKSEASAARGRERARCAAIFASPHAAANVALAASLAFETTLPRKQAIAILESQPARAPAAAGRAAHNPQLGPGGQVAATGKQAISASWDRAFKKVGATRG